MLTSDSIARLTKVVLATAVMLFAAWQITPTVTVWHRRHLANQLAEEIAATKDAQVKVPLRQMSKLGEPALHQLVIAAASQRAAVSTTARQILSEKVATWQQLADSDAFEGKQLGSLAASLAAQIDHLGSAGKQWAEHLTLDLIDLASVIPADQTGPLLADCSHILAAIPPRGPKLRTITTASPSGVNASALDAPQPKLETLTGTSEVPWSATLDIQTNTTLEFQVQTKSPLLAATPIPAPKNSTWSPAWKGQQRQLDPIPKTPIENSRSSLGKLTNARSHEVVDVPNPQKMKKLTVRMQKLSSDKLMQRLHISDFYEAGIIRAVLLERGYDSLELALLQKLASPNVVDRLQIIEDLADLPAASARRILRRLLEDQNAEVRLQALTAIATTNDPDIGNLARELAVNDKDSRVSELASRILKQFR